MRRLGLFVILFASVFVTVGCYLAWSQQHKLATWVPVSAVVESKYVTAHRSRSSNGGSSVSYKPHVSYRYTVGGQEHRCDQVTPTDLSSSESWARGLTGRFRIGERVTVFHDPEDPGAAFLVREATFLPYFFVLFPMIFVVLGVSLLFGDRRQRHREPQREGMGYRLAPEQSLAEGIGRWKVYALLWWGVGLCAFGHFLWVGGGACTTFGTVVATVYFGFGLIPGVAWVRSRRLRGLVEDAQVVVERPLFHPGDRLRFAYLQRSGTGILLEGMTATLQCERTLRRRSNGKTRFETETLHEESVTVLEGEQVGLGGELRTEFCFDLPEDARPSALGYPRVLWQLVVEGRIVDGPDYRAKFPFPVLPADRAEGAPEEGVIALSEPAAV